MSYKLYWKAKEKIQEWKEKRPELFRELPRKHWWQKKRTLSFNEAIEMKLITPEEADELRHAQIIINVFRGNL